MATKKTKAAPGPRPVDPKTLAEAVKPEPEPPITAPAAPKSSDLPRMAAVALLAVFVIILAWHFLGASATTFVPGPGVDANTFKDTFTTASRVLIVMDVRGAANDSVSHNVLQCGVDFSGSSGMGGKNVTHMSLSKDGCVADDGDHTVEYCISQLKDGVVIYVQPGASSSYYSDALVVGVGAQYAVGSCAIKRA